MSGENRKIHAHICCNCGCEFSAIQRVKKYCSLKCYVSAPETVERLRKMNDERRNSVTRNCATCGAEVIRKRSQIGSPWSFCSRACHRTFLMENFDKFISTPNPEDLDLVQNFDEFFTQDELCCPVKGCTWSGLRLGQHARYAHGFDAQSMKLAMGANSGTGLVSLPEHVTQSERAMERIASGKMLPLHTGEQCNSPPNNAGRQRSREAREHSAKTLALLGTSICSHPFSDDTKKRIGDAVARSYEQRDPIQTKCRDCGDDFQSKHPRQTRCKACHRAHRRSVLRAWRDRGIAEGKYTRGGMKLA